MVFSPASGSIAAGSSVVLTAPGLPVSGYIFFTTDGTFPSAATSTLYTGGSTGMQVNQSETINAISYAAGLCTPSALASATYVVPTAQIDAGTPGNAAIPALPIITPTGTTFTSDATISITSTSATTVCYTLDGTTPACGADGTCVVGAAYDPTVQLVLPPAGATIGTTETYSVAAIGCAAGQSSAVATAGPFTFLLATATAPTLDPTTGISATYNGPVTPILVNGNASAVTACYTLDGTIPGCSQGVCSGATTQALALGGASSPSPAAAIGTVIQNNGTALTAIACGANLGASAVAVFTYAHNFVLTTPIASVPAGYVSADTVITLSTTSTFSDTIIAYSFDGSPPDCAGTASKIINGPTGPVSPSDYPPPYFSAHLLAQACAGTAATNQTTSALLDVQYTVVGQ